MFDDDVFEDEQNVTGFLSKTSQSLLIYFVFI
jgi:hypothetical protein